MRITVYLAVVLAALIASGSAFAFEKQTLGTQPKSTPEASEPAAKDAIPLVEGTDPATPRGNDGTAIKIPGLGTVGVLPKMDFGMELLYGSDPAEKLEVAPEQDGDGLQIRGTLKHRF